MFRRKAFLHWYTGEGMDEMVSSIASELNPVIVYCLHRNLLKLNLTWTISSANTNNTKMPLLKVHFEIEFYFWFFINFFLFFRFCRRRWRWWRRRRTRRCLNQPIKQTHNPFLSSLLSKNNSSIKQKRFFSNFYRNNILRISFSFLYLYEHFFFFVFFCLETKQNMSFFVYE